MECLTHRAALCLGLADPFAGSGAIHLGCMSAGSGCNTVENGPVERRIDDVVIGHVRSLLNAPNLKAPPRDGYGAKSRIVQCPAL